MVPVRSDLAKAVQQAVHSLLDGRHLDEITNAEIKKMLVEISGKFKVTQREVRDAAGRLLKLRRGQR